MGRGPKPTKGNTKPAVPRKSRKKEDSTVRDLEKRLAEALKLQREAQDQQTATSDVLKVISESPTDVQPVFDAIVRHAVRLCGGRSGILVRYDGELMHLAAYRNVTPEGVKPTRMAFPRPPNRNQPP